MLYKTRGIVLHALKYGETSLIVHVYTEKHGRQSLMVKGVRKSKGQNRSNLFQPLFLLDLEIYHKESREIQLISSVSRSVPLTNIPYNHTLSMQALFMAEVLYRVLKEEEGNPMLFHFLVSSVEYLDSLEMPAPDFHILFLFQLSRYLGFYPVNNYSDENPYFDLVKGSFKPFLQDDTVQIGRAEGELFSRFLKLDYRSLSPSVFSRGQRNQVLKELLRFYRFHNEGMGEVRSAEVLAGLFG
ncbi:MAG: DNA repair protein RecO [Bacteroidales bacterium]|nr:DNA repair protein RecO [Bacteroidales bacterium]